MSDRQRDWLMWAQVLVAIGLILTIIYPLVVVTQGDKQDFTRIESISRGNLIERLEERRLFPIVGDEAEDYFRNYVSVTETDLLLEKYLLEHPLERDELATTYGLPGTYTSDILGTQIDYEAKFGGKAMRQAAHSTKAAETIRALQASVVAKDETSGPAFLKAWIASLILAITFFVLRLKWCQMLVWPEVMRILVFALAWPIMVFKYPTEVSPIEQYRRLRRWVAWLIASALPLMSMGVARAQEKTSPVEGSGTILLLNPSDIPRPIFTFSAGIVSQKIAGNGVVVHDGPITTDSITAALGGATFDFSQTRAISGSKASDEDDYTASFTWPVAEDTTATAGLALFDIRPIGTARDGDVLSPFIGFDRTLGDHNTLFARGEAYLLTGGDKGRNGVLLTAGVRDSRELDFLDLSLNQTFSVAYGIGPFGQDEGWSLRYEGALSKAWGRLKLEFPKLKIWVPVVGARDRSSVYNIGGTLAYGF